MDIPGSGAMHGISLSDLTAMGQQEQKQHLGERLYLNVINIDPLFHDMDLAGKITGMLLELDNADILDLLESQDALHDRVQEALAVLEAHQQKESISSQLAATVIAGTDTSSLPPALEAHQQESTISEPSAAAMVPPTRRVNHTAVARNHTAVQGVQFGICHIYALILLQAHVIQLDT